MDELQTRERNKQTVQRSGEQFLTGGALGFVDDQFASEHVLHASSQPGDVRGSEALKAYVRQFRSAFPDVVIQDLDLVAEGDTVAVRYAWHGTHAGELLGIAPTGKPVEGAGMAFVRFEQNKVEETWVLDDLLGILRQLGAVESPDEQSIAA